MSATTCRVLFASLGVPTHVSCILILLIAIDRYRSVCMPCTAYGNSTGTVSNTVSSTMSNFSHRSLRPAYALLLVFLALFFSLLAAFPVAYYTGVDNVLSAYEIDALNQTQFNYTLNASHDITGSSNSISYYLYSTRCSFVH